MSTPGAALSTMAGRRERPHLRVMTTIYMDESGFTGDDLYNAAQPHFVIASSLVGDEEAAALIRRCWPRYQGQEFKSSTILRRQGHRDGLRAFARELPALADRIYLWIVDKRFCLMTKMFDYLVEPSMHAAGFDFYGGGYAMRYMNTVHRDLLACGVDEAYDEAVRLWNAFAQAPGAATMDRLKVLLGSVARTTDHPVSTIFSMLHEGARRFEIRNPEPEEFADSSEIQVTSVLSSVVHWRQRRPEDFDLVHDESKAFAKQADLWATIVRDDYAVPAFEQANGSIVELPLRVRSTTPVKSHDSAAVQLCDLLAGFGAKLAPAFRQDHGDRDPFLMEVIGLGAGALDGGGVRPHDAYAESPMSRAQGPDMLDRMVGLLEPHLAKRASRRTRAK